MTTRFLFAELSDRDLLEAVKRLASDERQATAHEADRDFPLSPSVAAREQPLLDAW